MCTFGLETPSFASKSECLTGKAMDGLWWPTSFLMESSAGAWEVQLSLQNDVIIDLKLLENDEQHTFQNKRVNRPSLVEERPA